MADLILKPLFSTWFIRSLKMEIIIFHHLDKKMLTKIYVSKYPIFIHKFILILFLVQSETDSLLTPPPPSIPSPTQQDSNEPKTPGIYMPSKIVTNTKPVLVGEHHRKFDNPLSYLGGPKLPNRNRWSVESVLSID